MMHSMKIQNLAFDMNEVFESLRDIVRKVEEFVQERRPVLPVDTQTPPMLHSKEPLKSAKPGHPRSPNPSQR
jgi:hypothetical protein